MTLPGARREISSLSVLVVGDLMLDEGLDGELRGLAPEAPAPVVSVTRRTNAPGGAANVAANVAALGARAMVCGAIGNDPSGETLRAELARSGVEPLALVEDGRPTTVKTRALAGRRLLLRMDHESNRPLASPAVEAIVDASREAIGDVDSVVISDYCKGVATPEVCSALARMAARRGIPLVANTKSKRLDSFREATMVSLNEDDARTAGAASESELEELAASLGDTALLITKSDRGMELRRSGRQPLELDALSYQAVDVTGAGDTVCAATAVALGAGCPLDDSVRIANAAAAIAVESPGTAAVSELALTARLA
jgi:D-beta-D-heptose 7-phosphate kinase/D-beta-D-heptose 1-phosphate adenosyltransferase